MNIISYTPETQEVTINAEDLSVGRVERIVISVEGNGCSCLSIKRTSEGKRLLVDEADYILQALDDALPPFFNSFYCLCTEEEEAAHGRAEALADQLLQMGFKSVVVDNERCPIKMFCDIALKMVRGENHV